MRFLKSLGTAFLIFIGILVVLGILFLIGWWSIAALLVVSGAAILSVLTWAVYTDK